MDIQKLRKNRKAIIGLVIAAAAVAGILGYNILTPEQVEVLEQLAETPVPTE